jgi:hypothetical protein
LLSNTNLRLVVAGVVLCVLLGTPSLAPAKEEGQSDNPTLGAYLVRALNLRPDKARILLQTEEKYDRIRQEALERIAKSEEKLEKLLSGEKPDQGKLKGLISAIVSDQDILVKAYKDRRDVVMATLTPVQQGKYLSATWKWQQNLLKKYGKHETGQLDENKKE